VHVHAGRHLPARGMQHRGQTGCGGTRCPCDDISRTPVLRVQDPREQTSSSTSVGAPVGTSPARKWCRTTASRGESGRTPTADVVHVIGKDIVVPPHPVLAGDVCMPRAGRCRPACTCTGCSRWRAPKMSKSRGTFLNARDYLDAGWIGVAALLLRREPGADAQRHRSLVERAEETGLNGELLANVGNLANRALSLVWKNGGKLTTSAPSEVFTQARAIEREIADLYSAATRARWYRRCSTSPRRRTSAFKRRSVGEAEVGPGRGPLRAHPGRHVARICARWLAPIVPRFARGVEEQSGAKFALGRLPRSRTRPSGNPGRWCGRWRTRRSRSSPRSSWRPIPAPRQGPWSRPS